MMSFALLREIAAHDQVWPRMAAKYGVENRLYAANLGARVLIRVGE